MALVRLPGGEQRSGSIGGQVWSHNRAGAYIRARSVPVNPNTDRQNVVRSVLAALVVAWTEELTEAQREAWEVFAANVPRTNRLGDTIFLSGQGQFIRSNSAVLSCGFTRVDDAPITMSNGYNDSDMTFTAVAATQNISVVFADWKGWVDEEHSALLVYQGLPQNASRNFFGGPYRKLGQVDGDAVTPPTSPVDMPAVFPFGVGQKIWGYNRILRMDGRLSDPFWFSDLAPAP